MSGNKEKKSYIQIYSQSCKNQVAEGHAQLESQRLSGNGINANKIKVNEMIETLKYIGKAFWDQ